MGSGAGNIIGLYRRHAKAWSRLRGTQLMERKWLDRFLALQISSPKILDIGCGPGVPIARYLIEKGCHVTGIDSSPEMIEMAQNHVPAATWQVADMRALSMDGKFDGLLAWDSFFHLSQADQRLMFPIFRRHAATEAVLMFTSGPADGEAIGTFEGEPLYHSSLDGAEYRQLLDQNGFAVVDHVIEDPDCGQHTVWIARLRS
jgi:SAM-dependent methyltransferase